MEDFDALDEKVEVVTVEPFEGVSWECITANGITYPKKFYDGVTKEDLAEHLRTVKDLPIRDDDVALVAFPRSGTNWAFEIMSMLVNGVAEYKRTDKNSEYMDLVSLDHPNSMPSPRVLNSHHLPRNLPNGIIEKGTKIVYVRRNPKDVLVSLFHLLVSNWPDGCLVNTFDQFVQYFTGEFAGMYFLSSWADHVKAWDRLSQQRPGQVQTIKFEDMVEDSVREIKKINDFLQCNRDDKLIKEIADACSFKKLKANDLEKHKLIPHNEGTIHRNGRVGDWKNVLTVAQNERVDKWLEKNLGDTDLTFRYSL